METKVLHNGLKVTTIINPSSEVVNVQIWIKCGSIYESLKEQGVSHFIEHLLFKGTRNHKMGELARSVESLGGELNAFTSMEQTCFYITAPSLYIKESLSSICDLVFYPLFDQQELDNEREVILEEIKRSKDLPDRVMMTNFFNSHFGEHPYSKPVLGLEEVIKNISRDDILDYYNRFYKPSNALLVVCGNVHKDKISGIIDEFFKEVPEKEKSSLVAIPKVSLDKTFSIKIQKMEVNEANFILGFPIPGLIHEDVPALDVLALILGQGESSRLVKSLRLKKGLVTSIYTSSYTPTYGGAFFIGFGIDASEELTFSSRLDQVFDHIIEEVNFLRSGDFAKDEIDKAKTILLSDRIYERETVDGFGKKIGSLISMTGGTEFEDQYFKWLKKVNKDDILKVIQKYLLSSKSTLSAVIPKDITFDEQNLQTQVFKLDTVVKAIKKERKKKEPDHYMSIMNEMTSSLSYNFDNELDVFDPEIIQDKSGAKIILRKLTSTPLVTIRILFPGGTRFENDKTQGLANLFARTWLYGADDLSYTQIADAIDGTASSIEAFSGRNSIGLSFDILKSFVPDILDLGTKILTKPNFDAEYFNTEKMVIRDEIKSMQDNLVYYSGLLLLKTIYKTHPYHYEVQGTIETVESFTREEVISLFNEYVVSNRMVISVTGDFDRELILNWTKQLIKKMQVNAKVLSKVSDEPEQTEQRITTFKKDSNQAHIALAYKTCDIVSEDRYVLRLISALLSGQSGRLFINLRDKKSLAYTVTPIMMYGPEPGYFGVYIACDTGKTEQAIAEIKNEISLLKKDIIDDEELLRAKNYILGRHVLSMQRFGEQAITMGFDELYGLGFKAMQDFSDKILKISSSDIKAIANKYFKDQQQNIVIVSKN